LLKLSIEVQNVPEVHGDGVCEGSITGVVVEVKAHVDGVTKRHNGDAIVAAVDVQRRDDITHEVESSLEVLFAD